MPQGTADGDSIIWRSAGGWQSARYALAGQSCPSGQFANATSSAGSLSCGSIPGPNLSPFDQGQGLRGVLDDGEWHKFASVAPAPGTYLALAKGYWFSEQNADTGTGSTCALQKSGTNLDSVGLTYQTLNEVDSIPFALMATTTVAEGESIDLVCSAKPDADGVWLDQARLVGIKIG